jgi:hypothetical protein
MYTNQINQSVNFNPKQLSNEMRMLWEQHVYWTRMVLISIAHRLDDQSATTARLLQNPGDIGRLFGKFYGAAAEKAISDLLTEHLTIGAQLITAIRDGQMEKANALTDSWYKNADKMAEAFAGLNPYYKFHELQQMLYTHLQLTTAEVTARLAGNYAADIAAFNKVEREALDMADYFTNGLIRQFS